MCYVAMMLCFLGFFIIANERYVGTNRRFIYLHRSFVSSVRRLLQLRNRPPPSSTVVTSLLLMGPDVLIDREIEEFHAHPIGHCLVLLLSDSVGKDGISLQHTSAN